MYPLQWRRKQFLNGGLQLGKENTARDRQAIYTNMPGGLQPLEPPPLPTPLLYIYMLLIIQSWQQSS